MHEDESITTAEDVLTAVRGEIEQEADTDWIKYLSERAMRQIIMMLLMSSERPAWGRSVAYHMLNPEMTLSGIAEVVGTSQSNVKRLIRLHVDDNIYDMLPPVPQKGD